MVVLEDAGGSVDADALAVGTMSVGEEQGMSRSVAGQAVAKHALQECLQRGVTSRNAREEGKPYRALATRPDRSGLRDVVALVVVTHAAGP